MRRRSEISSDKVWDAVYEGRGVIKALRKVKEGENINVWIPKELMEDYLLYHPNKLMIRQVKIKKVAQ